MVVALVAVVLASVALPAGAKVPGPNGLIAFDHTDFSTGSDVHATYIMNPDGTGQPTLAIPGGSVPYWSSDGTMLAAQTPVNDCPPCSDTTILNLDTATTRVVVPSDSTLAAGCSLWSPDTTQFACEMENPDGSRDGLYTIRTSDGGGLTQITSNPGGADVPIDYSPDGKQIVFGRVDANDHSCTKTSALYVVNVDGSGLHRITPGGFCDDDGSWSPNGKEIAFATMSSTSCPFSTPSPRMGCRLGGSIYVVHPDGTGLTKVALRTGSRAFAGDVSWSPDGTKIAFILTTPVAPPDGFRPGNFQEGIATANADGTDVQQLTNTGSSPFFDHSADWGPHPLLTP